MEIINVMSYDVKLKTYKTVKVPCTNNTIKVVDKHYHFNNNFENLKEGFVSVLYKVDGETYLKDVWFTPNNTKTDNWYMFFQHPLNVSSGRKTIDIIKDILEYEVDKIKTKKQNELYN